MHSDLLEIDSWAAATFPFVKYGGLKFLEAAHVKGSDLHFPLAENRDDDIAGFRVLQLLPGIGLRKRVGSRKGDAGRGRVRQSLCPDGALRAATQWPGHWGWFGMVRATPRAFVRGSDGRVADLETLEGLSRNHAFTRKLPQRFDPRSTRSVG